MPELTSTHSLDDLSPASKAPDPTHLLDLFRQFFPPEAVGPLDPGNGTLFSTWLVIWLMVWQRSRGNASPGDATAEVSLGPTSGQLPDCKLVRDRNISVNTSAYRQARSRVTIAAAEHAADLIFARLTADLAPAWKRRHAYLIDGPSLTLAHYPELMAQLPPRPTSTADRTWPVVRFVAAHDLSTGFSPRWEWGPMYVPDATAGVAARELSFSRTLRLLKAFARGMIGAGQDGRGERFERLLKGWVVVGCPIGRIEAIPRS